MTNGFDKKKKEYFIKLKSKASLRMITNRCLAKKPFLCKIERNSYIIYLFIYLFTPEGNRVYLEKLMKLSLHRITGPFPSSGKTF